jgi:hypothetical protein
MKRDIRVGQLQLGANREARMLMDGGEGQAEADAC